jgi:hypothetical protein
MKHEFKPHLFYDGFGDINYQFPNGGGPPITLAASNGVFFDTGDNEFKWGTGLAGSRVPFDMDRAVDFAFHEMHFLNAQITYDNPQPETNKYILGAAGVTIEQIFTNSLNNQAPYERHAETNPNGGPPDDNVYIQGWNIDSQFDASSPSWTQRWEYKFQGNFYEFHIQWSDNVITRLYRLMSMTFRDHGGVNDVNLVEFQGAIAFNNVGTNTTFWSVAPSTNDVEQHTFQGSLDVVFSVFDDGITPAINWFTNAGVAACNWLDFTTYTWGDNIPGHTAMVLTFAPTFIQLAPADVTKKFVVESSAFEIFTGSGANPTFIFAGANQTTIFADFGVGEMVFQTPSGGYQLRFISNGSNSLILDSAQRAKFFNTIQTPDPGLGVGAWLLGAVQTAASTFDATRYVQVQINGTVVKLAVVT